jgi:arginine/lysine/ornithine decarboxylase
MMEPPGGTALVRESIVEALDFRNAMRKSGPNTATPGGSRSGARKLQRNGGGGVREDWILKSSDKWHGFGALKTGFNMLDPIKATIITPGLDIEGKFADVGIPAAVVTKYLAEHGVVVERPVSIPSS